MLRGECSDSILVQEATINYQQMMSVIDIFQTRRRDMGQAIASGSVGDIYGRIMDTHFQRSYAIGLTVGLIINCMLCTLCPDDESLPVQAEHFVREIIDLSEGAEIYRPLGASYMSLCLMVAWVSTNDHASKLHVEQELEKYMQDFYHGPLAQLIQNLKGYSAYLRLADEAPQR